MYVMPAIDVVDNLLAVIRVVLFYILPIQYCVHVIRHVSIVFQELFQIGATCRGVKVANKDIPHCFGDGRCTLKM